MSGTAAKFDLAEYALFAAAEGEPGCQTTINPIC